MLARGQGFECLLVGKFLSICTGQGFKVYANGQSLSACNGARL